MERLKSVSRSQELKLALKTLGVGLGFLVAGQYGGLWPTMLFAAAYVFFYFRPGINTGAYWASYFINLGFLFAFPWDSADLRLQVAASIAFAVVFGLILSVKDIIFIRRDLAAHAAYFIILGFLTFFFFAGMFGEFGQVATTISIFLVAREFYRSVVKNSLAVYPLFAAFLYSEILWAIYAIPIGFTAKSALAMVAMFLSSDVIVHHLKNNLSVKVVLRNVAVFILFLLAILQVVAGS